MPGQGNGGHGPGDHGPGEVTIHIDDATFRIPAGSMSGAEIRQLPTPAIGPELDLWLDVPGGSDRKIENTDTVELRNGMHLFTAPGMITPGGSDCFSQ